MSGSGRIKKNAKRKKKKKNALLTVFENNKYISTTYSLELLVRENKEKAKKVHLIATVICYYKHN